MELYSARVLDEDKSAPVSRVVEAIYWAIEKKVNIISLSFGMTVPSAALETAVKEAYDKGILIVAAAGNHGVVEYPAAMDEVMAVGGTDTDGTVCDYSAEGEQVEIVAPAEKVKATAGFDGAGKGKIRGLRRGKATVTVGMKTSDRKCRVKVKVA